MASATTTRKAAPAARGERSPSLAYLLWRTTIGKKTVMAVTGLVMLAYLVVHMLGNLKVFLGPDDLNDYAHWLRTIGEPALKHEWFLWLARFALLAAVVLHAVAAWQLTRADRAARPVAYAHRPRRGGPGGEAGAGAGYATHTMRWGGVILVLFLVWHILDLTTGHVNPNGDPANPYDNIVASFSTWYGNAIYLVAMIAVGLHVRHGFRSAARSLGVTTPRRTRALNILANVLAGALTAGFLAVPIAVMTGVVS